MVDCSNIGHHFKANVLAAKVKAVSLKTLSASLL